MTVGDKVLHRLSRLANGPTGAPAVLGVALGVGDGAPHHDDAVARLIGIHTAPAYQAQYAEHAGGQANNQQQDGNNLLTR